MLTAIVAFCSAATFGAGDRIPFLVVCIASGIALGADLALPPSILADTIDANKKQTVQHGAGSYFGLWTLVTKANLALAAGLALPLVGAFGYRAADPSSNLAALTTAYALIPCALKLLALALLLRLRHRL
jgi:Na+/melibiose symporter-like transporter